MTLSLYILDSAILDFSKDGTITPVVLEHLRYTLSILIWIAFWIEAPRYVFVCVLIIFFLHTPFLYDIKVAFSDFRQEMVNLLFYGSRKIFCGYYYYWNIMYYNI